MSAETDLAFGLRFSGDQYTGDPVATLFVVECEFCGERYGGYSDFPLLEARDFPDCSWRLEFGRKAPTMSWSDFERVIERARGLSNNPALELVPNSSLGPISIRPIGRWPKQLNEIDIACPGGLLLSSGLVGRLADEKLAVEYAPVTLRNSAGDRFSYALVQTSIGRVVHPDMFAEFPNYRQCAKCGDVKALRPSTRPLKHVLLDAAAKGNLGHFFRVLGFLRTVLVSDKMKAALEKIQPSGLQLEPWGIWK